MLRFLTAGESHGPALTTILEGLPAGLPLVEEDINRDLRRRQQGYGRGARQLIEQDQAVILSGVVDGMTIGSPVALNIANRDWEHWRDKTVPPWTKPRPGHADLAGSQKYGLSDLRLVAERASARETAARVAVGAIARRLLSMVGITVGSYIESIGGVDANLQQLVLQDCLVLAENSPVRCPDARAADAMCRCIDAAGAQGESLGGIFIVAALGLPVGLGSYVHWDRRLDGLLAQAVMSIPAIKGVEIGSAFANAALPGTQVQDALYPGAAGPERHSNRAGGLEGGMTSGEPLLVRAAMKPIPTTISPQPTVDLATGEAAATEYQRSDVCAAPAAAVTAEAMVAIVLAQVLLERFGADTMNELIRAVKHD
ncbi:MAG: chorismate synthase [Chloroflexi bacterium]|nr:chorismate synthase [Chloroflexota bacterium]